MDQVKIGKFIAECRKKNNLTQMQLAEKLNITDRAISKWENGKAMPDSSIMLDLCKELKINVNIGGNEIRNINKKDGTAGGGIWLNEKYQKNGYGTEAFSTKIKYSFDVLGLRRMENGYFAGNEKSKKMQERLGLKSEGIRRKGFLCLATREYVDECITGLLKEEFVEYNK